MNLQIRGVKTKSGNISIQVISRPNRKLKVEKHIGTGKTLDEILLLKKQAQEYIQKQLKLLSLPLIMDPEHKKLLDNIKIKGIYHNFIYEFLCDCYKKMGFDQNKEKLIRDLAIIRIVEPSSKLRAIQLLEKYFRVSYSEDQLYKKINKFHKEKETFEQIAIAFARENLDFDFSIVFYDVTTLYFESFKEDEFKKCGFSKDNKFNQPQILIALIVDKTGFPIAYEIFEGNKFEGHTFIPSIIRFQEKNNIEKLTILADAAMLSRANIDELKQRNLNYVVGARIGNLPMTAIEDISSKLNAEDGKIIFIETDEGKLICDYSKKRANKDKADRKKQILRAERSITQSSKAIKKLKFVKIDGISAEIDKKLVKKSELLEGIKGYYTNLLDVPLKTIIERYKDLWKIEKAFRIAKNDLEARPIYHWKKNSIESHILIVFISLCITKFLEIRTGLSIKTVKSLIWDIHDAELLDCINDKIIVKRMELNDQIKFILEKIGLCY